MKQILLVYGLRKLTVAAIFMLYGNHIEVRPDRLNKTQFFPRSGRVDTAIWMHYIDANKKYWEKASLQLHKNAASNIEKFLATTIPENSSCATTYHPLQKLSKLNEPIMQDIAGEVRTSS